MKYYAVAKGRLTGIFETWDLCQKQVFEVEFNFLGQRI